MGVSYVETKGYILNLSINRVIELSNPDQRNRKDGEHKSEKCRQGSVVAANSVRQTSKLIIGYHRSSLGFWALIGQVSIA